MAITDNQRVTNLVDNLIAGTPDTVTWARVQDDPRATTTTWSTQLSGGEVWIGARVLERTETAQGSRYDNSDCVLTVFDANGFPVMDVVESEARIAELHGQVAALFDWRFTVDAMNSELS